MKDNINHSSGFSRKFSIVLELFRFLKDRKEWWLAPVLLFLIVLGALLVASQNSALAPFIYALF